MKPENILLQQGKPYLTDFGLSLSSNEEDPETRLTAERGGRRSGLYRPEKRGGSTKRWTSGRQTSMPSGSSPGAALAGKPPPSREQQRLPENQLAALHRNSALESLDNLFSDMIQPRQAGAPR